MALPLTVADLYTLDDAAVKATVLTTFLAMLQAVAGYKIGCFEFLRSSAAGDLGNFVQQTHFDLLNDAFVNNVAAGLVCSAIARSALYGFSKTIDQRKADAYWRTQLEADGAVKQGRALYDWAFSSHCKSVDHGFHEYLADDPKRWAATLAKHITTAAFITDEIGKLIGGQDHWFDKLNLVLYKLHRLDPSVIPPVIDVWKKAYPDFDLTPTWATYNYLASTHFRDDQLLAEVNQAISEYATTISTLLGPTYDGRVCCASRAPGGGWLPNDIRSFLSGDAVNRGLTTGAQPDVAERVCWPDLRPHG